MVCFFPTIQWRMFDRKFERKKLLFLEHFFKRLFKLAFDENRQEMRLKASTHEYKSRFSSGCKTPSGILCFQGHGASSFVSNPIINPKQNVTWWKGRKISKKTFLITWLVLLCKRWSFCWQAQGSFTSEKGQKKFRHISSYQFPLDLSSTTCKVHYRAGKIATLDSRTFWALLMMEILLTFKVF